MKRCFCDVCGFELVSDTNYNRVVLRDREKKKEETILHLCDTDTRLVRNMKFIPFKNCKVRRAPKFYNVKLAGVGGEKSLYVITEWNLPQLQALKKADKTKLFTRDGKRYYTPEYVLMSLEDKNRGIENLMRYTQLLYNCQTADEKQVYETKWHNNVGFNKSDAKFMSAMARVSFSSDAKSLSKAQLDEVKRRFKKYASQVADLLNEQAE